MNEIGNLLRNYIAQSGYTVHGIAEASGINRSTLQKVLLENRKPSAPFIDQLLPLLKLSPKERTELLTIIELMNSGKALYNQRIYIKQMLEHVAGILYGNAVPSIRPVHRKVPDIPYQNTQIFHGGFAVEKVLNELMEQEAYSTSPVIRINLPGHRNLVSDILLHSLYYCGNYQALDIRHLIYLTKSDTKEKLALENLEILGNIIPFICASDFPYHAGYRYHDSCLPEKHALTAFPYSVSGNSWCVLISPDCTTAMYCDLSEAVRYLNLMFDQEWAHAVPLSSTCSKPEDILPLFIRIDQQNQPNITLEHQPCLPAYLTEDIIRSCARPDIARYEEVVKQVHFRSMQLNSLTSHTSLFTKTGLMEFTQTGRLSDFPPEYANPLSPRQRILILERFYEEIASNQQKHRMINPVNFSVSAYFNYLVTKSKGLIFLGYNSIRQNYDYIVIEEPGLIDAFYDFSVYLADSSYVYSREDTLDFIRQCIRSLQ